MLDYMVSILIAVSCGKATSDAHMVYGVGHFKQEIRSAQFKIRRIREDAGTPVNDNSHMKI